MKKVTREIEDPLDKKVLQDLLDRKGRRARMDLGVILENRVPLENKGKQVRRANKEQLVLEEWMVKRVRMDLRVILAYKEKEEYRVTQVLKESRDLQDYREKEEYRGKEEYKVIQDLKAYRGQQVLMDPLVLRVIKEYREKLVCRESKEKLEHKVNQVLMEIH